MMAYPRTHKYESGERFYNFVIISPAQTRKTAKGYLYPTWTCVCDCGTVFVTTTKQIRRGVRKSCGCVSKHNRFKPMDAQTVALNARHGHYMAGAKRRNRDWELSFGQFSKLVLSNCRYCGMEPHMAIKVRKNVTYLNGIDRVNNDIGYTAANTVPCCKICNCAKGAASLGFFMHWLERVRCA
jgi:hypothetical protein